MTNLQSRRAIAIFTFVRANKKAGDIKVTQKIRKFC
jgi:hypothetical protein